MAQVVHQMFDLPEAPLDEAAHFLAKYVPSARDMMKKGGFKRFPELELAEEVDSLVFVFPSAGKEHQGWRLAAIQALAREAAPKRVNGIVGDDSDAIHDAIEWLASAAAITGQVLAVDGKFTETR